MESMLTSQVSFTTSSNYSPALTAVPSVAANVNNLLVVTNAATDQASSSPSLTYSLAGGPANMFISPTTGKLKWRPQIRDGGTTNGVTVQVTDNTTGFANTQTFNVVVSNACKSP